MVVVDSGVWIDFFNGADTPERATLRRLLHRDRDFDAFEQLRGMRAWQH